MRSLGQNTLIKISVWAIMILLQVLNMNWTEVVNYFPVFRWLIIIFFWIYWLFFIVYFIQFLTAALHHLFEFIYFLLWVLQIFDLILHFFCVMWKLNFILLIIILLCNGEFLRRILIVCHIRFHCFLYCFFWVVFIFRSK